MRRPQQLELPVRTWGGKRPGAGRKPSKARRNVAHVARPEHKAAHPVHVTLRGGKHLPSFRAQRLFRTFMQRLAKASHSGFRVVEFSVQHDHVHFIVEAPERLRLSRGVQGLAIRLARALNGVVGRRGKVWADRFHARDLRSPREVRNALVYVLMNVRKHASGGLGRVDPCSSGMYFEHWTEPGFEQRLRYEAAPQYIDCPVVAPRTWLGREGWMRGGGLLDPREHPASSAR